MGKYTITEEDKAQFAAYYNMARRNSHSVLKHIAHASGIPEFSIEENHIHELSFSNLFPRNRPEQKDYVTRRLYKYFPFIKTMIKKEKEEDAMFATPLDVETILTNIFKIVHLYRNHYSHFSAETTDCLETEKRVASYLNECFTISLREIKKRYELEEKDLKFITSKRYKNSDTEVDENNKPKKIPNQKFEYTLINEARTLTDMGKVFLVCLFIEKKYATMLFDALGDRFYFNFRSEKQRLIIREAFSAYSIRLPRERIDSERNDMMLAMDMLNELKKSPSELFDCLIEEDKDKFKVEVEKAGVDIEDISQDDSSDPNKILLRRYSDRFPQLALRYIDDLSIFKNLRFHVNYGKYRMVLSDSKHCIDGTNRVRVIQKELNGFGRINEIEKRRTNSNGDQADWNGVQLIRSFEDVTRDETSDFPYITDSRTRYLFHGDKIGIAYYANPKVKGGIYMPNVGDSIENIKPVCWLSRYEIPAMIFHSILERQVSGKVEADNTEKIITNCVKNYIKLFEKLRDGEIDDIVVIADPKHPQKEEYRHIEKKYEIAWTDIPRKIRDLMTGQSRESFNVYVEPIIKDMIERTQKSLERFKDESKRVLSADNKMGKKRYVEIRPGNLASFLARDILRFQPSYKEGKDKLTGLNYRVMQASIAMYNTQIYGGQTLAEFKQMFIDAKIIGKNVNNKHPFLASVLNTNPKDTTEFYKEYLEEKVRKLQNILDTKSYDKVGFLHPNRRKWAEKNEEYFKSLAEDYLKNPIELPRGLFESSIKEMILSLCHEKNNLKDLAQIAQKEQCSVAYLINQYTKYYLQDTPQIFYEWRREYDFFKVVDPKKSAKTIEGRDIDIKETIKKWRERRTLELKQQINNFVKNGSPRGATPAEKMRIAAFEQSMADFIVASKDKQFIYKNNAYKKEKKYNRNVFNPTRQIIDKYKKGFIAEYVANEETKLKRKAKYMDENERALRRYQTQDILMFLMSKDITVSKGVDLSTFKLRKIAPNSDKGILSSKVPEFKVKLTFKVNGIARSIIVTEKDLKIKNYGNFMHLLHDSRLESMSRFMANEQAEVEVDRYSIEQELDRYDTIRPSIFSAAFAIEKRIIEQFKSVTDEERRKFRLLIDKLNIGEDDKEILISIRNKFGHNEYPYSYTDSNKLEHSLLKGVTPTLPLIAKEIKGKFEQASKST